MTPRRLAWYHVLETGIWHCPNCHSLNVWEFSDDGEDTSVLIQCLTCGMFWEAFEVERCQRCLIEENRRNEEGLKLWKNPTPCPRTDRPQ